MNTPVLTNYGTYRFEKISLATARKMAQGATSAVGHEGAAKALSFLLGVEVPTNRRKVSMRPGDSALVFKILERLPEGAVLTAEETLQMPYEFGKLERIA